MPSISLGVMLQAVELTSLQLSEEQATAERAGEFDLDHILDLSNRREALAKGRYHAVGEQLTRYSRVLLEDAVDHNTVRKRPPTEADRLIPSCIRIFL
jgi:hypothetical protein